MKEKEMGKNETEKKEKKGVKKIPMRESNPRPLNLQLAITTTELQPQGLIARTKPTYTTNLNEHELRVASLAALAPPIIMCVCGAKSMIITRNQGVGMTGLKCHVISGFK